MSHRIDKYPRKHRTDAAATVQVKLAMIKCTYIIGVSETNTHKDSFISMI